MTRLKCITIMLLSVSPVALGATATFHPWHDVDSVLPGTDMIFDITVAVESLSGFDWADIIIGMDEADADISFQYSGEWNAAFANVSPITYDTGLYAQDVFAGGNNPVSVGTGLALGRATIDTSGLSEGTYLVVISSDIDGTSALGLDLQAEGLYGTGPFRVVPEPSSLLIVIGGAVLSCRRRMKPLSKAVR